MGAFPVSKCGSGQMTHNFDKAFDLFALLIIVVDE